MTGQGRKRYVRLTPLRYCYEWTFDEEERSRFIRFLWSSKDILREIASKGGKVFYVIEVLRLIKDEEEISRLRQQGREVPYLWSFYSRRVKPVLASETNLQVLEVDEGLPEVVLHTLDRINDLSQLMIQNLPGRGDLTISCNLSLKDDSKEYSLLATHKVYIRGPITPAEETGQRGRRGEPQSNVAMYLLYQYFRSMEIRNIYIKRLPSS